MILPTCRHCGRNPEVMLYPTLGENKVRCSTPGCPFDPEVDFETWHGAMTIATHHQKMALLQNGWNLEDIAFLFKQMYPDDVEVPDVST